MLPRGRESAWHLPISTFMKLHEYLAREIVRGTRKHLSSLTADFLQMEQTQMNNEQCPVPAELGNCDAHRVDQKDLITGEDSRAQAASAVLPNQPAVRSEDTDAQGA
jgi:hypothetical protein